MFSFTANINNANLHDAKRQIGLIGMLIGAGEITGTVYVFLFLSVVISTFFKN